MNTLQQFAYDNPLRSADAPMRSDYFRDAFPLRYGLSVNF